ncbi:MAG: hypothetical protein MUO50_11745, partial [Longimicrobiales bacterium]|nr:hypothetical protein [Longimicrobiales bacterium]
SALFYAIAHQEPTPIQEVWPECPPALGACVSRCLEKDRDVRYRDFKEVTADLRTALSDLPSAGLGIQGVAGAPAGAVTADSATEAFMGGGAARPEPVSWRPASRGGKETPGVPVPGSPPSGRRRWLLPLWGILGVALVVALFEVVRFPGRSESSPVGEDEALFPPTDNAAATVDSVEMAPSGEAAATEVAGDSKAPAKVTGPVPAPPGPEVAGESGAPVRGSATLVLFWSGGGDPGSVTTAENAFLEELERRGLRVVEAGLLAGIHGDAAAVAMAQGMDARSIAGLGREYDAEVLVVGSLRTEASPSAGRFFTGRAVLDVRTYRASTGELLGSATYQVGSDNTPGELGPSPLAAETEAAKEVGRRAAMGIARDFGDALPKRG